MVQRYGVYHFCCQYNVKKSNCKLALCT